MSYYCAISFKELPITEMQSFLCKFKQECTNHLEDIAKENWHYAPYIRRNDLKPMSGDLSRDDWAALSDEEKKDLFPRNFRNVDRADIEEARAWMRGSVFYFRYGYDAERSLLYVFGASDVVKGMFDGTVEFQNSTDQDYERDSYKGVKPFEAIWDKWNSAPEAEILQYYYKEHGVSLYDEVRREDPAEYEAEFGRKLAYYRRDAAYNEIFNNYEGTLYNDDAALYLGLYNNYDISEMNRFVKACHDACVNDKEEAEIEWVEACLGIRQAWFDRIKRFTEASGGRCDAKEELAKYIEKNPGFLEKYPQYKDAVEAKLAEPDEPEHDEESL